MVLQYYSHQTKVCPSNFRVDTSILLLSSIIFYTLKQNSILFNYWFMFSTLITHPKYLRWNFTSSFKGNFYAYCKLSPKLGSLLALMVFNYRIYLIKSWIIILVFPILLFNLSFSMVISLCFLKQILEPISRSISINLISILDLVIGI